MAPRSVEPALNPTSRPGSLYRRLLALATLLAFAVVGFGAYVRLSDAGLGCPDWPGCYGQLVGVPAAAQDSGKAWKEMIHRYLAGSLGLVVVALCVSAWRAFLAAPRPGSRPPVLATGLVVLIGAQAALGMWTVTLLLKPVIVTAHLLGGMATWALLVALALRAFGPAPAAAGRRRLWKRLALASLFVQIALGGWVSSNYAGLACPDLPACHGEWWPAMDFGHAFTVVRALGETAVGTPLPGAALTAIQWTHRVGAVAVALIAGGWALSLVAQRELRGFGLALLLMLATQLGLGVANVLLRLPLPLALAHNLGAALLLALTIVADHRSACLAKRRQKTQQVKTAGVEQGT